MQVAIEMLPHILQHLILCVHVATETRKHYSFASVSILSLSIEQIQTNHAQHISQDSNESMMYQRKLWF